MIQRRLLGFIACLGWLTGPVTWSRAQEPPPAMAAEAELLTADLVRGEKWDILRERYLAGMHAKHLSKDKDLALALKDAPTTPGLQAFLQTVAKDGSIHLVRALASQAFAKDAIGERAPAMLAFARRADMTTLWDLVRGPLANSVSPRMTEVLAAVRTGARKSRTLELIDKDLATFVFSKPHFGILAGPVIADALSLQLNPDVSRAYLKEVFSKPHSTVWAPEFAHLLAKVNYEGWMNDAARTLRQDHWRDKRYQHLRDLTKIHSPLARETFLAAFEKQQLAANPARAVEWERFDACGRTVHRLARPSAF